MKKITFLIIIIIMLFAFVPVSRAQIHLSIGPQVGVALPMSDFSGEVTDFYNGTKYGLNTGFNIGATVKADLMVIAGRLDINYAMFKNDGNISGTTNTNSAGTVKMNSLIIGIGPEYNIDIPLSPIKPYGSIELLITSFSGSFQFQNTPLVSNSNSQDIASATRIGLGFLLGTEFKFGLYALDLSLRYNILNVGGKSFSSYTNNDRTNSYLNLNDDKDPNYDGDKHPVGSSRNMSSLQINVGFLFGF